MFLLRNVCSSTPLYSKDGTSDNKTAPVSSENEESPSEKAKSKLKLLLMSTDTVRPMNSVLRGGIMKEVCLSDDGEH